MNNLDVHHVIGSFEVGKFQLADSFYRQSDGLIRAARRIRESQTLSLGAQHAEHLSTIKPLAFTVRTEAHSVLIVSGMSTGGEVPGKEKALGSVRLRRWEPGLAYR